LGQQYEGDGAVRQLGINSGMNLVKKVDTLMYLVISVIVIQQIVLVIIPALFIQMTFRLMNK
jgi:TctA family transporter